MNGWRIGIDGRGEEEERVGRKGRREKQKKGVSRRLTKEEEKSRERMTGG